LHTDGPRQHGSNPIDGHNDPARRILARRACCLLLAAAAIALDCGVARLWAQSDDPPLSASREYAIKAAYLYQFGRYVQWPPDAFANEEAPLVIGILGQAPFGNILDEIARTKRIEKRPIVIRRFATMNEYKPCHILFVVESTDSVNAAAVLEKVKNAPVLLVGEEPEFAAKGGVVNFFLDENNVRFEINVEAARQRQLKISSKLLSLAKIVGEQPH